MEKLKTKLAQMWEENPQTVITAGTAIVVTSVAVLNAVTSANNSRTWRKEVNRRTKKSAK
jgi:hypothetical protein